MELFEYVLLLLAAILLSNIIHRFLPMVSVPIIQILLGVVIAFLPLHIQMELDPELFFVLFIAPLIFDNSVHADKDTLWKLKLPIISLAFGLVFVSVIVGGLMVNALIPAIPIAAGCALIGALGPTDDVAVAALAKRVKLPYKLMNILEGESVFNDASGIVSFQFALAAVMTGMFSPARAVWQFGLISLGGIAVGLLLTGMKYLLVKWIRSLGLENVTLHVLLEVLTPFLVFMAAEAIGCSGVFASFTAGVLHSFAKKRLNPNNVKLNNASESVWDMLSFTLNGLVFLLMGIELPGIIKTVITGEFPIATWQIILYVLLITLFFVVTRFVWSLFIHKKTYAENGETIGKVKAGIIISLSGARGAVTLASILSIPILLDNRMLFPERDLLILISAGVILFSLALANFVLPLLLGKEKTGDAAPNEGEACIEILQGVVYSLQTQATSENKHAVERVTRDYYQRINSLQSGRNLTHEERTIKNKTLAWEIENTRALLKSGEISEHTARHYLDLLEDISQRENRKKTGLIKMFVAFFSRIKHFIRLDIRSKGGQKKQEEFYNLKHNNDKYVLARLRQLSSNAETAAVRKVILEYELSLNANETRQGGGMREGMNEKHGSEESMKEVLARAFQLERDGIYAMYEQGRISRESAKEMRNNIAVLEAELAKDAV